MGSVGRLRLSLYALGVKALQRLVSSGLVDLFCRNRTNLKMGSFVGLELGCWLVYELFMSSSFRWIALTDYVMGSSTCSFFTFSKRM
jgi:hypothetical protein